MPVTIYDVAKEAGVSMATVSRVVNGNPNVKPATRKKVKEAIQRLGYRPNAVARGLASKRTKTVGVVIPDVSNPFYSELVRGIEDIANMYDYNIFLCNSDEHKGKELRLIETMLEKQVDGLLFMGAKVTQDHREILQTGHVPVVLSSTLDEEGILPSVSINHGKAMEEGVHYLHELGHQRIALISGPPDEPLFGTIRLQAFRRAMTNVGLTIDENMICTGDMHYESGFEETKKLLQQSQPPTAIFAVSDEMAIGAIHAILDQGLRVPEDISVLGFDNTRLATMVRPLLTTVVQPMYDIGAVSMRLLTKYMMNEEVESSCVILPHRIEVRQSTCSIEKG
ncbi:catabolite control protein A [Rubeoparvulum massiliense]|uniref:catabolite control protein A n=1 Tax=Rubeoparvulum massiliense TaxID=1631346 RepID=UPI00065E3CAE|nr:catabolite control protein A [Rubeoparvulum massiliense]